MIEQMLPSLPLRVPIHHSLPSLPPTYLDCLLNVATSSMTWSYCLLLDKVWPWSYYEKSSMVWLTSKCWFWSQTIVTVGQLSGFLPKSYYRVRSLLILISSSKQLFKSSGHFSGHKYLHHGWPATVHHQCHHHK